MDAAPLSRSRSGRVSWLRSAASESKRLSLLGHRIRWRSIKQLSAQAAKKIGTSGADSCEAADLVLLTTFMKPSGQITPDQIGKP